MSDIEERKFKVDEHIFIIDYDWSNVKEKRAVIVSVSKENKNFEALLYQSSMVQVYSFDDYKRLIFDTRAEASLATQKMPNVGQTVFRVVGSKVYNSHKTFSSFQANLNILSGIATIFTPVFSGFIIEKFSYNTLFLILAIEVIIVIITSTRITNFYIDNKKVSLE